MVHLTVDLGELDAFSTAGIDGFPGRLMAALPGLIEHGCSEGRRGGFESRLHEGTWLGHVVEHVALEVQRAVGARTTRGKTRAAGPPGVYDVVFAYEDEAVGRAAGDGAIDLVNRLVQPLSPYEEPAQLGAALIADLQVVAAEGRLGMSTQAIVDAAHRRDIPVRRLDGRNLVQLGWGVHARRIRATVTSTTSLIGAEIARDKDETSRLLELAAVPTPVWRLAATPDDALAAARAIGLPVVIKPIDGNHGRGVSLDIADEADIAGAFTRAAAASRRRQVVVQRQVTGRDHRILVVGGRMVACAERVPATVIADGRLTVRELVDQANADPRRGVGHAQALTRIALDDTTRAVLRTQGLADDDIPAAGRSVALSRAANLSTGGTSIDRTDEVHPEVAAMAELAARVVGLEVAGIDVITTDIGRPLRDTGGAIIEVNAGPGFRMHTHPTEGQPRDVGAAVVRHLFGRRSEGRIPVAAVTGSNGKTTTVRLLAHLVAGSGLAVGSATTEALVADGLVLRTGDMAGPASARLLLSTPTIEAAVLEVARGGILRDGLGYDFNDVAVVTNVTGDHLGLGGIDTLEQLADVKAVIVDAVPRSGTAVLNADDPLVLAMAERCRGAVALTTMGRADDPRTAGPWPSAPISRRAVLAVGWSATLASSDWSSVAARRCSSRSRSRTSRSPWTARPGCTWRMPWRRPARRSPSGSMGRSSRPACGRSQPRRAGSSAWSSTAATRFSTTGTTSRRCAASATWSGASPGPGGWSAWSACPATGATRIGSPTEPWPARSSTPCSWPSRPCAAARSAKPRSSLIEAASRREDGQPSRAGSPTFVADEAEAACVALCAAGPDDLVVLGVADGPRVLERLERCPVGDRAARTP